MSRTFNRTIGYQRRNHGQTNPLGIGGTPFTTIAIKRAVALAKEHGASLKAVTVVSPEQLCKLGPVPAGAGHYAKRMCENRVEVTQTQIEASIASLEARCRESDVPFEIEREVGDTFSLIIDHARYHDLTLFGLRSMFEYQIGQEPEKDLIKLLSKGVRPIIAVSDTFRPIHKVMIAYSGSMESANAMKHFVQLNLWSRANWISFTSAKKKARSGSWWTMPPLFAATTDISSGPICCRANPRSNCCPLPGRSIPT